MLDSSDPGPTAKRAHPFEFLERLLIRLFYTDQYPLPLPAGHRFPIRKYRLLLELLERDAGYVRSFLGNGLEPAAIRRIGFPWSEEMVARTLASAGGTLSATEDA